MKPLYFLLMLFAALVACNSSSKTRLPQQTSTDVKITPVCISMKPVGNHINYDSVYGSIKCGVQDKAGNMWFGTTGAGVYRFNGSKLTNFTSLNGLCNDTVYAILQDKVGIIWFGTANGLCRYDAADVAKTGKDVFTPVAVAVPDSSNYHPYVGKSIADAPKAVWSMIQDKDGKIWLGTGKNGVYCYDGKTFTHFLDDNSVVNKNHLRLVAVMDMVQDSKGNIWFTTWFEGLCRYDGKAVVPFKPMGEVWFGSLLEDKSGNIWVGSRSKGAYRYSPSAASNKDSVTFTNVFKDTKILNASGVFAITEDMSGNIWFGAEFDDMGTRENFGGAWRYNPTTKALSNFTKKEGLHQNTVYSITPDKSGDLWMGTRRMGLSRFDGKRFLDYTVVKPE